MTKLTFSYTFQLPTFEHNYTNNLTVTEEIVMTE